jgi:integrase
MQKVIGIMRSFLRFLAASGKVPIGLDRYLDSRRHHRGERLARALDWEDILSLLRAIDRSTLKGRRDYAMLRSEVSCLEIDDIQWRARIIRVPRLKVSFGRISGVVNNPRILQLALRFDF